MNTGLRLREALELRWQDLQMQERSGTMRVRAALLGHVSLTATAVYTKPRAEDLAAKIEKIPVNADVG